MDERAESLVDELSRTVLPDAVQRALAIGPGDVLVYVLSGESVTLRSSRSLSAAHLAELDHTFSDWSDPADESAFAYLSEPPAVA